MNKIISYSLLFVLIFLSFYSLVRAQTESPPNGICTLENGDFNLDGATDLIDFDIFRVEFTGQVQTKNSDSNCDGVINLVDFNNWRKGFFAEKEQPPVEISPSPPIGETLRIEETQNGQRFNISYGQKFIVALEQNPSTGYSWQLTYMDSNKLKKTDEIFCDKVSPDDGRVGSPCTTLFEFESIGFGQTALKLEYKRTWEDNIPPQKTFQVFFVIE